MKNGTRPTVDELRKGPLLRVLNRDELERISRRALRWYLDRNEVLFQQGDTAERFYLVVKGHVELHRYRVALKEAAERESAW